VSKEERQRIYEYAMDRKNREIKQLEEIIKELRETSEQDKKMLIAAEVFLFLVGVLAGALLMKTFGTGVV
jgi:flagellin-specific chaperone FliS